MISGSFLHENGNIRSGLSGSASNFALSAGAGSGGSDKKDVSRKESMLSEVEESPNPVPSVAKEESSPQPDSSVEEVNT